MALESAEAVGCWAGGGGGFCARGKAMEEGAKQLRSAKVRHGIAGKDRGRETGDLP